MSEKNRISHTDYRKAKIVHLFTSDYHEEFFYKGKRISKEDADAMVIAHRKLKSELKNRK